MVNVIEDVRQWNVNVTTEKEKCPYRYFPANIIGCKLVGMEEKECTLENCVLRSK